jgi:hypothetical protein
MKKWFTPLFVLLTLGLLAGCASTSQIIATGLKVQVARVTPAADGSVEVTLRVVNPNVVPYLIDHSAHKISLNGQLIGTAIDSARLGLAAGRSEERKLALTAIPPAGLQAIAAAAGQDAVAYRVESTVWLLLVDDDIEKASLNATGVTPVAAK